MHGAGEDSVGLKSCGGELAMILRLRWCLILGGLAVCQNEARGDQFEQIDGPMLARILKGADATPRAKLTVSDIAAMEFLFRDTRSALVLAKTDLGNPVKLLVVPELRKPASGQGEPIPVVVLERLDTFDASDPSSRIASRRDVVIFDGFQVDLDTGQVVPEGQGGDVVFRIKGDQGNRLEPVGSAGLFTLAKAPALDNSKAPQPTPGKTVVPGDFAGRYRLYANGQWSGTLDLKVEGRGVVVGQFRSDLHGTTYQVSGQVATDVAQKVFFAIKYPRARQEFEGFLWAEGKGAIAGVASLNERPVGFFAIREGGRFAPEGADVAPLAWLDAGQPGRQVVEVVGEKIKLEGKDVTFDELVVALRIQVKNDSAPPPWVLIRASKDQKFSDVIRVAEAIQMAGMINSVRFETAKAEK
jgi:hypothetical protein